MGWGTHYLVIKAYNGKKLLADPVVPGQPVRGLRAAATTSPVFRDNLCNSPTLGTADIFSERA